MAHDAYFFADGIEAEHLWVNEWSEPQDAEPRAAVAAPPETTLRAASEAPVPADAPRRARAEDVAEDQLLRDMAEIAAARDALDREPAKRRVRLVVGGAFGLAMLTVLGVLATL
ncbi:MAG: hypothetical protein M5U07_04940 [Xanthobacteraceae bacterium]|nr:hypothetical protein [Xanthobacteraceae bacterium]